MIGECSSSQSGVDGSDGAEEPVLESGSSDIEAHRASSCAPEQMRSEPRDLRASSFGVDRGAPSREGHEARSGYEPRADHRSPPRPSVLNPDVRSGADSEQNVRELSTALVRTAATRRRPRCSTIPTTRNASMTSSMTLCLRLRASPPRVDSGGAPQRPLRPLFAAFLPGSTMKTNRASSVGLMTARWTKMPSFTVCNLRARQIINALAHLVLLSGRGTEKRFW